MNPKKLLENKWIRMLKNAVVAWWNDQAPSKGAALAYYSMFSIAPLLFLIISIAGLFFGADAVRGMVFEQVASLMGQNGAEAIEEMLTHVSEPKTGGWAAGLSIAILLFGASTVFGQLQTALDTIWRVPEEEKEKEKQNGLWTFIRARLLTFGMVLGLAFLVTISLILSTALSTLGKWWGPMFGQWELVAHGFDLLVSFGVLTVVFAAIYKLMPRASIQWRDVWVGGFVTALLFVIGKFLIGLYLGKSDIGSSFGAFGSIVIVMVWIYYSAQIFLLGAEFTWAYAHAEGSRRGESPAKPNLGEAAAPAPAPRPVVVAPTPVPQPAAPVPVLKRKGVFGVSVAAAFLGGAVLRVLVVDRWVRH
ncbi:MAG TPA: YihY/virulence factor BrkB family protein [Burkholderiales bacterium]|nr:YihY/virulence factor BrkB family protein [Burkholderiales bacterium]